MTPIPDEHYRSTIWHTLVNAIRTHLLHRHRLPEDMADRLAGRLAEKYQGEFKVNDDRTLTHHSGQSATEFVESKTEAWDELLACLAAPGPGEPVMDITPAQVQPSGAESVEQPPGELAPNVAKTDEDRITIDDHADVDVNPTPDATPVQPPPTNEVPK